MVFGGGEITHYELSRVRDFHRHGRGSDVVVAWNEFEIILAFAKFYGRDFSGAQFRERLVVDFHGTIGLSHQFDADLPPRHGP